MNALRHGILAKAAFNLRIEGEERRGEFDALLAGLAQEYQPRTMTEVMAVQQLAGCYWRLAKVWTFEMEAAWRACPVHNMGATEHDVLSRQGFGRYTEKIVEREHALFEEAGLGEPNLPLGPSAATIIRYQGSINTMMTRCLALLEQRRMQRAKAQEAFEEVDYMDGATAPERKKEDSEAQPASPARDRAKDGAMHKRTQKAAADAKVSSEKEANPASDAPVTSVDNHPDRPDSA